MEPRPRPGRQQRGSDLQRSALERLASELLKRGVEAGRDTLRQTDEALKTMGESPITKEISHHVTSQLGDIRDSLAKAVASEIGKFLRQADLASEIRKALSGMTVDAKVRLGFPDEEERGEGKAKSEKPGPPGEGDPT